MEKKKKIIFLVDDNLTNLQVGKSVLSGLYRILALTSGAEMLKMIENVRPDLILLDVNMPEMDGYEAIVHLKASERTADIPVIFLTGLNDEEMELKGLSLGAIDYITKPFSPPLLLKRIEVHLLVEEQKRELLEFNNNLTQMVEEKTKSLLMLKNAILTTMAELVEYRDEITGSHIVRTQHYVKLILDAMKTDGVYSDEVRKLDVSLVLQSSQLHDVGKIAISDTILNKPDKLTDEEYEIIKSHTNFGKQVIERLKAKAMVDNEFLSYAGDIAVSHHEKWDGSGYPCNLKGEEIPLLGRIMAIADVYDALTTTRPYKKAFSHEKAAEIIREGSSTHFDPKLIELFSGIHGEFEKVALEVGL